MEIGELRPGDAGWVLEQHGVHYAAVEGFGTAFEALVARVLAEGLGLDDPARFRGWIARDERGVRQGCIFLDRREPGIARVRLFYVCADARGTGLAQALLDRLEAEARAGAATRICIATHECHRAAGRVYARNGYGLTASHPVHRFGRDLVEEAWEKRLAPI